MDEVPVRDLFLQPGTLSIGMVDRHHIHHLSNRIHFHEYLLVKIQKFSHQFIFVYTHRRRLKNGVRHGFEGFLKTRDHFGLYLQTIFIIRIFPIRANLEKQCWNKLSADTVLHSHPSLRVFQVLGPVPDHRSNWGFGPEIRYYPSIRYIYPSI